MPLVHVNGIDVNYIDSGEGDVIVLLHGLGSSYRDWDMQIPVLSENFRVIAPDFRAHGSSTKVPEKQGVEYMKEDIYHLLKCLNIKQADFIGFSMGGAVAFQLAVDYPDLVKKLVIINSGPDFNNPNASGVDILVERTNIIKQHGFNTLAQKIAEGMFPDAHQTAWREEFKNRILNNDEDAYLLTFAELMKWGLGDKISKIQQPTLVIASDNDYTSVEYKQLYVDKIANARLVVIPNSRHGVVLDAYENLNVELLKFIKNG